MTFQPPSVDHAPPSIRDKWRWFVGLGLLTALCGLGALLLVETATVVSIVVVGVMMIAVGAVEIVIGFKARSWDRAIYWELTGLIYIVAGAFAVAEPVPASVVVTLILGAGLVATGLVRLVLGFRRHESAVRLPLMVGGAFTTLLGLVIVIGWPSNSLVVIGTLLGIDLLFNGMSWVFFGLRLRSRP